MYCYPRFQIETLNFCSCKFSNRTLDETFGEKIAAVIVSRSEINEEKLKSWCRENLASYKTPKEFIQVEEIEKNAMGKINKKILKKNLFPGL